ncbi:hypothetical protein RUM43_002351 [Polyplax serrata]|uniref:UMP-CMP kinase n=1 Tax=Polyplax serrata TaxID=468196 RepID=A0AAN8S969_POLSC
MSGDCKSSVIFVLGPPGSGKGTQCSNIIEKYDFKHLSAGDLLRLEKNTPGSPFGKLIEDHIRGGTIVPARITCSLLERGMHTSRENFFLIDGFPRNKENAEEWDKELSGKVNVLGVLFFDCNEDVCIQRCLSRGAAGSGRSDDNEDSLRKRFITYKSDTMPVINHFKEQQLVYTLDSDKSPTEVFTEVEKVLMKVAPTSVKKQN